MALTEQDNNHTSMLGIVALIEQDNNHTSMLGTVALIEQNSNHTSMLGTVALIEQDNNHTSTCTSTLVTMAEIQPINHKSFCFGHQMSCDMTKPTMWLCAQRRLRSAWASAQSDQSLRCALNG